MPTDEDAVDEPAASTAPRYNLMDRDVQPPGYNVYREKKESFTDCIWHCYPAECCMCLYVMKEKGGCPAGCLGTINVQLYTCCTYVPCGRCCPGRRWPCCAIGECGETNPCCPMRGVTFIDEMYMDNRGPGWVMQAKSNAHTLDIFTALANAKFKNETYKGPALVKPC